MPEANKLLDTDRLLTLAGPGGSGKTRLALAVASELVGRFEDRVWLVELAPLSDPDLVPKAVASVLGVRETPGTPLVDALIDHLGPRNVLLILDDCEHLIDATDSLAGALLRRCPGLRGGPLRRTFPLPTRSAPLAWPVPPEETEEAPPNYPAGLSAREVEVLRLVARGLTDARVAEELYISPRTVNAHMGSVYHKIGSSTRAEATRFATEHGLL